MAAALAWLGKAFVYVLGLGFAMMVALVAFIAFSQGRTSEAIGGCQMEFQRLKSTSSATKSFDFIPVCMRSKGYRLSFGTGCILSLDPETQTACYKSGYSPW